MFGLRLGLLDEVAAFGHEEGKGFGLGLGEFAVEGL